MGTSMFLNLDSTAMVSAAEKRTLSSGLMKMYRSTDSLTGIAYRGEKRHKSLAIIV